MRHHGSDPFHQRTRVRFGLALIAMVAGIALLADAGLATNAALLRGTAGVTLLGAGIWTAAAWFRA